MGMNETALPLVTVMIATRNRVALLPRALASVFTQDYPRMEVLIVDDASSDGTSDYVRSNHPNVRLFRFEENHGLIAARNLMMLEAKGEYIVSLDDDAYFINPDAVSNVICRMQREPEVGVVTFRIRRPKAGEPSGSREEHYTTVFGGGRHCVRKAAIDKVGLYREFFFHQAEESDLSLRLLDKGYRILFFPGAVVVHDESPIGRDVSRAPTYRIRNLLLSCWINEPFPWWVLRTGNAIVRCALMERRTGNLRHVFHGMCGAIREIPRAIALRCPVSSKTEWIYVALRGGMISDPERIHRLYEDPPRSFKNMFR